MDREFIAERQRGLQNYLNVIMANHVLSNCELLKKFLDPNNYSANYTGKKQGLWGAVKWGPSSARAFWRSVHICNKVVFLCKDLLGCNFLYIYGRDFLPECLWCLYRKKHRRETVCLCTSGLPIIFSLEQSRQPTHSSTQSSLNLVCVHSVWYVCFFFKLSLNVMLIQKGCFCVFTPPPWGSRVPCTEGGSPGSGLMRLWIRAFAPLLVTHKVSIKYPSLMSAEGRTQYLLHSGVTFRGH